MPNHVRGHWQSLAARAQRAARPRVEELQRVVEQLFPLRGSALRAKHYFRQRCHGDVTLTHKPGPKQEGSQQTKSVPLTEGFAAGANDISVNG
jgi:hypothetical protein